MNHRNYVSRFIVVLLPFLAGCVAVPADYGYGYDPYGQPYYAEPYYGPAYVGPPVAFDFGFFAGGRDFHRGHRGGWHGGGRGGGRGGGWHGGDGDRHR